MPSNTSQNKVLPRDRTDVRSIINTIKNYRNGTSLSTIRNRVNRGRPGYKKVSMRSVKRAVNRAVSRGDVKPPRGWKGFRKLTMSGSKHRYSSIIYLCTITKNA